jgi:hypothetical protein
MYGNIKDENTFNKLQSRNYRHLLGVGFLSPWTINTCVDSTGMR